MINYEINGSDLIKALKQFPRNVNRNIMVGATRASANTIRDESRRRVPKRSRNLEKSIQAIQRKAKEGQITFTVTPAKGVRQKYDGWYAHFIEFGTVKQSAKPFMRPAFESSADKALQVSKEYIANRIPKEVEKAKK